MTDPIASIQNLAGMLQLSLDFTMKRIEDYHSVTPEAVKLSHECQLFQMIVQDVIDKPYLPINMTLQDVYKAMNETNDLIGKFLKRDNRTGRSFLRNAAWKLRRIHAAYEHRNVFKDATEYLRISKENIKNNLTLSAQLNTPTIYSYSKDMVNQECFAFWKATCGEALHAPSWALFIETYQQRYNIFFDSYILERMKKIMCQDKTNLTITGYVLLTRLCDFPISLEKLHAIERTDPIRLTANYYKQDMVNPASFTFWLTTCGRCEELAHWDSFITNYQKTYEVCFDNDKLELMRGVAVSAGNSITITDYIRLTKLCGFPFDLSKLQHQDSIAEIENRRRMEIKNEINNLLAQYVSKGICDRLEKITQWYKGYSRHNTKEWNKRAEEWAKADKNFDTEADEQVELAYRVDWARQAYVSFFWEYKRIFEMDKLSEEMFIEVDFPGKARIYEFLDLVKPLEKALHETTNPFTTKPWKEEVLFTFLEGLVEMKAKPSKKMSLKIKKKN